MMDAVVEWLLESGEPWTRYRTLVDLLDRPTSDADVQTAHVAMLTHPLVQGLIAQCAAWGDTPFKRHNDASYPIYALSTLADFGVRADDPGMAQGINRVLAHQSAEGAFQSVVNIPKTFGGTGEDLWTWIVCDAPTLLYALLAMGLQDDARVRRAVVHLAGLVDEVGWRCIAAPELGKFKGPGKGSDPCPIANVYALKALALLPELREGEAAQRGAEMLLGHWAARGEKKYFLFGIGSDFRKLKYPFVWYNILHVVDVLSRFPFVRSDPRFKEMAGALLDQVDENGRCTAASIYQAWKGWSFADKKQPSPWLTFLVQRIRRRIEPA